MDWFKVIAAGISGAVAVVVARLVLSKAKERRYLYSFVVVITFFIVYGLLRAYIVPDLREWNDARTLESKVLEKPVFQALKLYEPEIFEDLMIEAEDAIRNGAEFSEMRRITLSYLGPLISRKLPFASDAATVRYMKATMTQVGELNTHPGDLGYKFLYPDPSESFNPAGYLSEEVLEEDQLAMAEVLRTSTENPQGIPDESEVLPLIESIWAELAEEYGDDISMLDNPSDPSVDKTKVCSMVVGLYTKIFNLPEAESGKVLRYMMSP